MKLATSILRRVENFESFLNFFKGLFLWVEAIIVSFITSMESSLPKSDPTLQTYNSKIKKCFCWNFWKEKSILRVSFSVRKMKVVQENVNLRISVEPEKKQKRWLWFTNVRYQGGFWWPTCKADFRWSHLPQKHVVMSHLFFSQWNVSSRKQMKSGPSILSWNLT